MLKPLTWILAILSFSSSNAVDAPNALPVKVPVEAFHRRPEAPLPLDGSLWLARGSRERVEGRAVLILRGPDQGSDGMKQERTGVAQQLSEAGFHVLALDLRDKGNASPKVVVEDIQSGVAFLKTDKRTDAGRVLIVASGVGANGAARYAGATRQMANILDGVALINLTDPELVKTIKGIPVLLVDPQKKIDDVCQDGCHAVSYGNKLGSEFRKTLTDFLMRPHG